MTVAAWLCNVKDSFLELLDMNLTCRIGVFAKGIKIKRIFNKAF